MSSITVCSLARLPATLAETGAGHVVTLINTGTPVPVSRDSHGIEHLFLGINDICEPAAGLVCPAETHLEELFTFMRAWDQSAPVLIHCFAGISRSTAAAYASYCALRPDADEAAVAWRLRARSPEATPNARIIALADAILGRDGRMVDAIAAIGRGREAMEGTTFTLRLNE